MSNIITRKTYLDKINNYKNHSDDSYLLYRGKEFQKRSDGVEVTTKKSHSTKKCKVAFKYHFN